MARRNRESRKTYHAGAVWADRGGAFPTLGEALVVAAAAQLAEQQRAREAIEKLRAENAAEPQPPAVNEANQRILNETVTPETYPELVSRVRGTWRDGAPTRIWVEYGKKTYPRIVTIANDSRGSGLHRAYVKLVTSDQKIDDRGPAGLLIATANREVQHERRDDIELGDFPRLLWPGRGTKRTKRAPDSDKAGGAQERTVRTARPLWRGDRPLREKGTRMSVKSIDLDFVRAVTTSPSAVEAGREAAGHPDVWTLALEVHRDGLALKPRALKLKFSEGDARRRVKAAVIAAKNAVNPATSGRVPELAR